MLLRFLGAGADLGKGPGEWRGFRAPSDARAKYRAPRENLAIMEREARSEREPQARQAKQEREDRSKHCKRRRRGSTKKSKNDREQDSKSMETASPDTRLKPRVGAARRRLGG